MSTTRNCWRGFEKCILALLLVPVIILVSVFATPAIYQDTFLGALQDKDALLNSVEGRRIVIIGGSNTVFGIDGALIEQELPDYELVNYGLYAGLGTRVMLELAESKLRSGDIVILIPEQHEQTLTDYFNGDLAWQALDGHPGMMMRLSASVLTQLLDRLPVFAANKLSYLLRGTRPSTDSIYMRDSFDDYGSIKAELTAGNQMAEGYDPTMPISLESRLPDTEFTDYLNNYIIRCEGRDVTLYYKLCPMDQLAVEDPQDADDYYDRLIDQLSCQVLGDPVESIMDSAYFYDTNFHLNQAGREVYTLQLIQDLKACLEDTSKTNIATEIVNVERADSSENDYDAEFGAEDANCFSYELTENGAVITGLSREAAGRQSLSIPAQLGDVRTVRLESLGTEYADSLEEIIIGDGVTAIMDGAFSCCGRLEKIRLVSEEPQRCLVGQGLLEGCGADIYVPEEALTDYKLSYWWSVYASNIKGDKF